MTNWGIYQGVVPTGPVYPNDLTKKDYVDSQVRPFTAPAGMWQMPANEMGTGSPAAPASGDLGFVPIDVGPGSKRFSNIGCGVSTAQVAGTTTTWLALYPDDGTGGMPQCAGGPIAFATVTLTATGNRTASLPLSLPPGRYWGTFLYVASVAPTTAPQVYMMGNAVQGPVASTNTIGNTAGRGWVVGGQSALPAADIRSQLLPSTGTRAAIVALQAA
jgi:hypothetical protein